LNENSRKFLWVKIEENSLKNLGTLPSKEDQKVELHSKREIQLISR
jgi:hypothetical protein